MKNPELLYHYTTRDFAEQVITDLASAYAEIRQGLFGPGFYALEHEPCSMSREELIQKCFGGARQNHPCSGVLFIDTALADPPFEPVEPPIWLQPGADLSREPIGHMIDSVGIWTGHEWLIEKL